MSETLPQPPLEHELVALRARIAELERRNAALEEQCAVFRTLYEQSRLGLVITLLDGAALAANPAFAALVGYRAEELQHQTLPALTHPDERDAALRLFGELRAGSRDWFQHQQRLVHRDGHAVPVLLTGLLVRDDARRPQRVLALVEDRTDHERDLARVTGERRQLEAQRLASLELMAASFAHEFNNIITTLMGHAELALLAPTLDEDTREQLQCVLDGTHRAVALTRQVLAYTGKNRVLVRPLALAELIRSMDGLGADGTTPAGELTLEVAAELPPVQADEIQLRQLISNLAANAREAIASHEQGGRIVVRLRDTTLSRAELDGLLLGEGLPEGRYVQLTVEDNGCGIDPANLGRIFDPFFSTRLTGRGLGLATVLGIVRAHHGAISVTSWPGAGTQVSVWLPAADKARPG